MTRSARLVLGVAISVFEIVTSSAGSIIHVPANQPTIQAGINAASNGDTVLVAPGTYIENINFLGKAITVKSSNGASLTTISSNGAGTIVTFNQGEGPASVLNGFTLAGAVNTNGISISSASPTIINNRINGNQSCDGAGISVSFGSPLIKGNTIAGNRHNQCSGGVGGGGIAVLGAASARIIGNVISNNDGGNGFGGGGIALWAAGTPTIMNNIITNNTIQTGGGAIGMANYSDALVVQNLITGNSASQGGGVYYLVPSGANGPVFVNNTFASNQSTSGQGSAVFANDFDVPSHLYNNVIFGVAAQTAVYCGNLNSTTPPAFFSNDVYASQGTSYGGICSDQTGTNGNISADPLFVSHSNFRLKGGSPVIDAGTNSAPNLPAKDFAGNSRITNGNGGPTAIVDMGAYEFVPVVLAPASLGFESQLVGSSTSKTVKLTNLQNKVLDISSYSVPTGYSVSGCGTSVAAFTSCTLTVTFHPLSSGTFKGTLNVIDDAGNSPQGVSLSGSAH